MYILGIWDGHDAGAALLDGEGGRIVCAVNEERLTRRKLEVGFPVRSTKACLEEGGISAAEISQIAVPTSDVAKTLTRVFPSMKERYYLSRRRKVFPGRFSGLQKSAKYTLTQWGPNPLSRAISRWVLKRELARLGFDPSKLRLVDHHGAHAASAAYTSGYDSALVVTLDGIGDGLSGSVWKLEDRRLGLIRNIPGRDSLGIFFEHVTNLLNMRELEDEGKVMALASYAYPPANGDNPLDDLFRGEGLEIRCRKGSLALRSHLARHMSVVPSEQFAWMAQSLLEDKVVELVSAAAQSTGLGHLAYAGGVASNIKANLKLWELPEIENIFVFPHMGDGGIALGAALWVAAENNPRFYELGDLQLGPRVGDKAIESSLEGTGYYYQKPVDLVCEVAQRLNRGEVVLWFQGRMEYGPRALGARSILTRPDRSEIRDRLNLRLKRRVWYQPFCPSILDEESGRLLEKGDARLDRYMTMAYRVLPEGRDRLAAVIGPDGTCRPQMVGPDGGRYRRLLEEFRKLSGIGAVLNTSFNLHGEPIVATPKDALRTLEISGADALAMGDFLVARSRGEGGTT
jgi:carbamoyltransferase